MPRINTDVNVVNLLVHTITLDGVTTLFNMPTGLNIYDPTYNGVSVDDTKEFSFLSCNIMGAAGFETAGYSNLSPFKLGITTDFLYKPNDFFLNCHVTGGLNRSFSASAVPFVPSNFYTMKDFTKVVPSTVSDIVAQLDIAPTGIVNTAGNVYRIYFNYLVRNKLNKTSLPLPYTL